MSSGEHRIENLAQVARRRQQARTQLDGGESHGVNALLSKLRIEQQRHTQNVAFKAARDLVKDGRPHQRYVYTASPSAGPSTDPFQLASTALLVDNVPSRTSQPNRRRTPGPSAPASWAAIKSFDTRDTDHTSRRKRTMTEAEKQAVELERRWRVYELWFERVVKGYVDEGKLPYDLQCRSRSKRRRIVTDDATHMTTSNDTTDSHAVGPPSLLANSIKVLSRFMDPLAPTATTTRDSAAPSASSQPPTSEETNSWLNSSDVKRFLAPDIRLGIMIHGVWEGSTRWKGVRDLAQGVDAMYGHQVPSHTAPHDETLQHESAKEDENDIDDWDASSSASSETLDSIIQPISPLPILDFSFSQFDDAPGVHRLHGSTLSREYRQLARFLRSHSVRTTVEAISFAGSSLTLRQAVELLSSGVDGKNARVTNSMGWIKLRSVSLAGLKTGSVDELKVALLKLARYGSSLEFIDLSGIELFPQQNWHWKALLSALLSARSGTDRFDYPALTVLGFRDNNQLSLMEEGSSPATSSAAASSNKGGKASGDDRDSRTRRMNEYEMEVKQLVRSFGRARWLDIVVK